MKMLFSCDKHLCILSFLHLLSGQLIPGFDLCLILIPCICCFDMCMELVVPMTITYVVCITLFDARDSRAIGVIMVIRFFGGATLTSLASI